MEEHKSGDGKVIAGVVVDVLEDFAICDKIGFLTLDNASNNDTLMEELGRRMGIDPVERHVRCLGHIINLVVKDFLFGKNFAVFEQNLHDGELNSTEEYKAWVKKGPVGKLHNLTQEVHRSAPYTEALLAVQDMRISAVGGDGTTSAGGDGTAQLGRKTTRKKALKFVTDNATRWLSQYHMIQRALVLRPFYRHFLIEAEDRWRAKHARKGTGVPLAGKQHKHPQFLDIDNQLTDEDWEVLEIMARILVEFEIVVKMLQGDGNARPHGKQHLPLICGEYSVPLTITGLTSWSGGSWDLLKAYEFLLLHLEDARKQIAGFPDGHFLRLSIEMAWSKLDKYYTLLSNCPVAYVAAALHPRYKFELVEGLWDEHPDWVDDAKRIVRDIWDDDYKGLDLGDEELLQPDGHGVPPTNIAFINWKNKFRAGKTPNTAVPATSNGGADEYERWMAAPPEDCLDPAAYWHHQLHVYPRLARMALDYMTVPPMSAAAERLFSIAGKMVTPTRSSLSASTISMVQALRSWHRAGLVTPDERVLQV